MKTQLGLQEDRVAIRRDKSPKYAGGILLPENTNERIIVGTIVSIGPGKLSDNTGNRLPMFSREGDIVLVDKIMTTTVELERDELFIVSEKDILTKIY